MACRRRTCVDSRLHIALSAATLAASARLVGDLPREGMGLAVWDGGAIDALSAEASRSRCGLRSAWMSDPTGTFVGYIVGAPSVVNREFATRFGANFPAGPVLLLCSPAALLPAGTIASPTSTRTPTAAPTPVATPDPRINDQLVVYILEVKNYDSSHILIAFQLELHPSADDPRNISTYGICSPDGCRNFSWSPSNERQLI